MSPKSMIKSILDALIVVGILMLMSNQVASQGTEQARHLQNKQETGKTSGDLQMVSSAISEKLEKPLESASTELDKLKSNQTTTTAKPQKSATKPTSVASDSKRKEGKNATSSGDENKVKRTTATRSRIAKRNLSEIHPQQIDTTGSAKTTDPAKTTTHSSKAKETPLVAKATTGDSKNVVAKTDGPLDLEQAAHKKKKHIVIIKKKKKKPKKKKKKVKIIKVHVKKKKPKKKKKKIKVVHVHKKKKKKHHHHGHHHHHG